MRVGVIGMGALGSALAENLHAAELRLLVWNRTRGKCEALASRGVEVAGSVADVAEKCDVIISCLTGDDSVENLNAQMLASASVSPRVHVSMSTISPGTARRIARRNDATDIGFLSCPVLGRPFMVKERTAKFLASGPREDFKIAEPVLNAIGGTTIYVGESPQTAAVYKLSMNFLAATIIGSLTETFTYVAAQGEKAEDLFRFLEATPVWNPMVEIYGRQLLGRDFDRPGFRIALGLKDLQYLADGLSSSTDKLLILRAIMDYMTRSVDNGRRDTDWTGYAICADAPVAPDC